MPLLFDPTAPKKAVNLSINSDLLKAARQCNINLSGTLESALIEQLKATKAHQWRETNRKSIAAYNTLVDEQGVFSDGTRTF